MLYSVRDSLHAEQVSKRFRDHFNGSYELFPWAVQHGYIEVDDVKKVIHVVMFDKFNKQFLKLFVKKTFEDFEVVFD